MKRTPLARRSAPMPQRKRMKPVSDKRRKHRASAEGQSDLVYMGKVAAMPCVICWEWSMRQESPTQVHHVIHGRYGTRKAPDTMTIPLCEGHHLGDFDTSKLALHREPDDWKRRYGPDHEWINWVEERITT